MTTKGFFGSFLFLVVSLAGMQAQADVQRGQQLHSQNCISCHASMFGDDGTGIYTRPNHRVTSLPGLQRQVRMCKDNLGLMWFDEDVADVAEYLNATYYHYKE